MKPHLLMAGQGGGSWGCFPVGALLEYFEHQQQAYDGGFGVSVSALILSQLMASDDGSIPAAAMQADNARRLGQIFDDLAGNESIYTTWPASRLSTWLAKGPLALLPVAPEIKHALIALLEKKPSVYSTQPLMAMVKKELAGKQWHRSVCVGVVHLETGEFEEVSLGNNVNWAETIVASTAIPLAFPPVAALVDGGVMDITPLKGVFTRFRELRAAEPGRPQELHVYRCSPFPDHRRTGKRYSTLPVVAARTLDIMLDNTDAEDFSNAVFCNKLAQITALVMESTDAALKQKFAVWQEKYGSVAIYVISPTFEDVECMPQNSRTFAPDRIRSGIERGRAAMKSFLMNKESYRLERLVVN
jgi:predicted acylesterase/phospholipase RssA